MFDLNKKEKPFTSFGGFGGGGLGLAGGGISAKTYVDDVFSTFLYYGTSGDQTIPNGIDLDGEGGLIWIKGREGRSHSLTDTVTGIDKNLISNNQNQQATDADRIIAKSANGFTLYGDGTNVNYANEKFVSWTFRKAPGFFDVVTWPGNSQVRNIPHNLGSTPGMIIVKCTSDSSQWSVWHRSASFSYQQRLRLNSTGDIQSGEAFWGNSSTAPDMNASTFSVGTTDQVNSTGRTYVAYVFAHDDQSFGTSGNESIIKCGSYTSTSGSNPNEVNLGFEPQWIMIKNSGSDSDYAPWIMFDNMRGVATGENDAALSANYTDAEGSTYNYAANFIDFTPTGFKTFPSNTPTNVDTGNFVYMAIRRPNKPPEAAINVFAIDTGNSSSTIPCWDSGFPVDFAIWAKPDYTYHRGLGARLMGTKYLKSNETPAEANDPDLTWDSNVGWGKAYASTFYSYMFKRAPGFMDVVTYTGNQTAGAQIPHNLGVKPELMLIKNRETNYYWTIYAGPLTSSHQLRIPNSNGKYVTNDYNSTEPTSTVFTIGGTNTVNENNDAFIAYLFASLPDISKIGTYSGNTGYAVNVDCGFTSGARFILIKRADDTGDWYVWDTTRGIVSGNDPYFLLNDDVAQVTNTDYIDPLSSGFTVTSSAPAALNLTGSTYLFLAIA